VKGVARVALRFDSITVDEERQDIRSVPITRSAQTTKKKDATKIGIGTAAGAVIGGIIGGGKGAAIGAGTGAGAGTAVVMSTRGQEVELPRGTELSVTLAEPLTVRIKL
jgi:outer membrane lipoprotein SlyB